MRLIDADALFLHLRGNRGKETGSYSKGRNNGINIAIGAIRNEQICPTVDAVPVVHGRWKTLECDMGEVGGYPPYIIVECSNCGEVVSIEQGQYDWAYGDPFPWKCCPLCGAKMDGGNENG